MSDPIKDAARVIVPDDAPPLTLEQNSAIGLLGAHMPARDTTAADGTTSDAA